MYSEMVGNSCTTSGTHIATGTMTMINGTYPWSFVTQLFRNG